MKSLYNLVAFLFSVFVAAQVPEILWQKRLGGNNQNLSYCSVITSDSKIYVGGRSNSDISGDKTENSKGNYDYWIVGLDEFGNILGDKTIGAGSPPDFNGQDIFMDMTYVSNGGHIACGYSNSPSSGDKSEDAFNESDDFWIVKTDALGTIVWENTIGGESGDIPFVVRETSDGGYIVGGYSFSSISGDKTEISRGANDYWILKLDSSGIVVWQKTYGGAGFDGLTALLETPDGFLLAGNSTSDVSGEKSEASRGGGDFWILRINNSGDIIWQKTIGGDATDSLREVVPTNDGGFLIGGHSNSGISGDKTEPSNGQYDYWIVKISDSGSIDWQRTYGGSGDDNLYSIGNCLDGGYIITGTSDSPISGDKTEGVLGTRDAWTVKINPDGNIKWQITLGGNGEDGFNSVQQTGDGGYLLSGTSDSEISGTIMGSPRGLRDYWVVRLDADPLDTKIFGIGDFLLYPNPSDLDLNIVLNSAYGLLTTCITSVSGQVIMNDSYTNTSRIKIDISDMQTGIYFLKISNEKNESQVVKFVKI